MGPFVKGQGRLGLPAGGGCPEQVYTEVMLPCWAHAAHERPSFGELYDAAIRNGGVEDDVTIAERAQQRLAGSLAARDDRNVDADDAEEPDAGARRSLLGPSIHHIEKSLLPKVLEAIRSIKRGSGHPDQAAFDALASPANATIWHTVHAYAKPISASVICPRDHKMGSAYVDTLVHSQDVGRATALLSYSWGYEVAEVSAALSAWAERSERDATRTYIWICSLCLNQHRIDGGEAATPDLAKEFGDRVVALGRILPMLEPWDDPGYVKRAWCLFELYTAIRLPRDVEVDIILSPLQAKAFHDAVVAGGYTVIDGALEQIRAEDAGASEPADLEAIRELIRGYPGGFETLNETVKQRLGQWFEAQGGIKAARPKWGFDGACDDEEGSHLPPVSAAPNTIQLAASYTTRLSTFSI